MHHRFGLGVQEMCESVFAAHVPIQSNVQYVYDWSDSQVRCGLRRVKRSLANLPLQSVESGRRGSAVKVPLTGYKFRREP